MQIPADPRSIKNFRLKLAESNYELHASNVNWTKTTNQVEWKGGTPDAVYADSTVGSHLANITLVHDYENQDSLFNFMIDHEGEQASVEYKPDADGTFTQTATITIVAPDVGGAVGAFGESTVACPSSKPVRSFANPVAPTVTALDPAEGEAAGGTLVAIAGAGFSGVTGVTFDGAAAEYFIVSTTLIHAVAPAGLAGVADVIVTNTTGASVAAEYTYTA